MDLGWYVRRVRAMSLGEIAHRARDEVQHQTLRFTRTKVKPSAVSAAAPSPIPEDAAADIDPIFVDQMLTAADGIVAGRWTALGIERTDLAPEPDWFWDPETGVRSDPERYAFDLNSRDPSRVGSVKNVWELSRHHHITTLAGAFFVSGKDVYAETAAAQLRSWWQWNPFLRGIHWTSGIELGIRLIAWVWTRRLLHNWEGASRLFEQSSLFVDQLYQHQAYLAKFGSYGSSANNHLIAEEAGRFVAACAFPMFSESPTWRNESKASLEREIEVQTFASGLNKELASDYHGFVLELFLAAALEGERSGHPLSDGYWQTLARMADAGAAFVDGAHREPRQGDGDQGLALHLDAAPRPRWRTLLPTLGRTVGRCAWWPNPDEIDVRTALWTAGLSPQQIEPRPDRRPNVFADAGMVLLRDLDPGPDEIWCRCDGGPFGFLSIAGHAHADALSIEVRVGGIDILADPGTYSYHTQPEWRRYFRSTRAHNTLEVGGVDQAEQAGAFNWSSHADAETIHVAGLDGGPVATWSGRHMGYARLDPPTTHDRTVTLDRAARRLTIEDRLVGAGTHPVRLAYHLGPSVDVELDGNVASLVWPSFAGERRARLSLPGQLRWERVCGEISPIGGWYSSKLGTRLATVALYGLNPLDQTAVLETVVEFDEPIA